MMCGYPEGGTKHTRHENREGKPERFMTKSPTSSRFTTLPYISHSHALPSKEEKSPGMRLGGWPIPSLVPRPSITANAVEGVVKLLRRMTSGRRWEAWHFR